MIKTQQLMILLGGPPKTRLTATLTEKVEPEKLLPLMPESSQFTCTDIYKKVKIDRHVLNKKLTALCSKGLLIRETKVMRGTRTFVYQRTAK